MPKRPTSPDREPITNEWGIYDPAKAGMQALYAKLGRPVLRASSKKSRQERRRAFRVERPNDGVGLAIEEAMRRAGVLEAKAGVEPPPVPVSPARAVRMALKVAKPPQAPFVPADIAPSAKKKPATRRARAEAAASVAAAPVAAPTTAAPVITPVAAAPVTAPVPVKTRAARKPAKARAKAAPVAAPEPEAVPAAAAAPVAPTPPAPPVHVGPPAPSPRRPRGPVPLAAWAHAVTDAPRHEPRRTDKRGFWKALFRMPAEVALVEYARGCRIHRLLIETSDDEPLLDLL